MLSSLWWLALLTAAAAVPLLWRAARRLLDERRALHDSIAQLAALRPRLAEARAELAAVAEVAKVAAVAAAEVEATRAAGAGAGWPI